MRENLSTLEKRLKRRTNATQIYSNMNLWLEKSRVHLFVLILDVQEVLSTFHLASCKLLVVQRFPSFLRHFF